MSEPVITLKGACQPKAGSTTPPPGCASSLTRAQFEKLLNALTPPDRPPAPPEAKRNFAAQYAKLLTFANAARALGLENDPRVQEIFQFAKNQILAESFNQHITEEYSHPSDQQIEAYYKENSKKYVEATLQRIIIPRITGRGDKPKPTEAEEKAYAEQIRQRWVAGEDPEKLQKEASEHAGATAPAANVNMGERRPGTLPEAHEPVFDLKPGEVSQPYSDPASFYIYKVVAVRQEPLSEAKTQISQILSRQLIVDHLQQVQKAVTPVLNDAYFGPEKPPVAPSPRIITPRRGATPGPGAGTPTPPPPPQGSQAPPK